MQVVSFIESSQDDVLEKILRHCGLWQEPPSRAPPAICGGEPPDGLGELQYVADLENVDAPLPEQIWSEH